MGGRTIEREKIFLAHPNGITTHFLIDPSSETSIIFRNGGVPNCSMKLEELSLLEKKR
jgi:hypothetical protein